MRNSSYLDMNRDIEVLRKIVDDYEAAQSMKQAQGLIGIAFSRPNVWQPVSRNAFALAS
jgi:hypothetical protein